MKLKAAIASLAALFAAPAMAGVVVIDFDAMTNNVHVLNYYSGGMDSAGHWGSTNKGVSFTNFVTAASPASSSDPRYAYVAGSLGYINVAAGFHAFSFMYGALSPSTISVYSGLNGTGTLLGSGIFNGHSTEFAAGSVPFSGLAHSVKLTSLPNRVALDDVAFTYLPPVPEPQTWAMLAAGLLVTSFAARRRK